MAATEYAEDTELDPVEPGNCFVSGYNGPVGDVRSFRKGVEGNAACALAQIVFYRPACIT